LLDNLQGKIDDRWKALEGEGIRQTNKEYLMDDDSREHDFEGFEDLLR